MTFVTCPISPLKLVEHHCDIIVEAARNGLPVNVVGMAMSGGSGPVHLAGTVVIQNCEILSSLVLSQLTCKGAAFVYGSSTCPLDTGMISAAVARMARLYGVPCFTAGG